MMPLVAGASEALHDAHWDMGFHHHLDFEVTVVLEGDGLFQFGDSIQPIKEGTVYWISPNLPHRVQSSSSLMRLAVIHAAVLPSELRHMFYQVANPQTPIFTKLNQLDSKEYDALFHSCLRLLDKPGLQQQERDSHVLRIWLELFMIFLIRNRFDGKIPLSIPNAADFIRTRLDDEIEIRALASQVGMSESSFREAFKKMYGLTPKQFQQSCRLDQAKLLLYSSHRSIEQIAHNVGLTLSSFSTWFRRCEGKSPMEWRESQRVMARQ